MKLAVRVTPRAKKDAVGAMIDSADGARLDVRLAAPPADGEANAALIRVIARFFGIRQADVEISHGAASRLKMLRLKGDDAAMAARLHQHLEQQGSLSP